jgi:hypothetical protein
MAYAGKGSPGQVKKLREYAEKLGIKELFFSDNPMVTIDPKVRYQVTTLDDLKLLPKDMKNKFFTDYGVLKTPYKRILETLLSEGAVSPDGPFIHDNDSAFYNCASHFIEIGILERQKGKKKNGWSANLISEYRITNPEIAKALISDYRLPRWKR